MATAAAISTANAINSNPSQVSEVLEVAKSILRRHQDTELAQKLFVMQEYLEISPMHPERDYSEALQNALADLTAAVQLHLNTELEAMISLFGEIAANSLNTAAVQEAAYVR